MSEKDYLAASCLMSLGAALAAAPVWHCEKRRLHIFSASLGIIIYRCVKSIFAECGWGFAALLGIGNGLAAQVVMTACGWFFFRTLMHTSFRHGGSANRTAAFLAVVCLGVGKHLLCADWLLPDRGYYAAGEAMDFALLLLAALGVERSSGERDTASLTGYIMAAVLAKGTAAMLMILCVSGGDRAFTALLLMTLGVAGMTALFCEAAGEQKELSPTGFGIGLTAAFCFDSLMGL